MIKGLFYICFIIVLLLFCCCFIVVLLLFLLLLFCYCFCYCCFVIVFVIVFVSENSNTNNGNTSNNRTDNNSNNSKSKSKSKSKSNSSNSNSNRPNSSTNSSNSNSSKSKSKSKSSNGNSNQPNSSTNSSINNNNNNNNNNVYSNFKQNWIEKNGQKATIVIDKIANLSKHMFRDISIWFKADETYNMQWIMKYKYFFTNDITEITSVSPQYLAKIAKTGDFSHWHANRNWKTWRWIEYYNKAAGIILIDQPSSNSFDNFDCLSFEKITLGSVIMKYVKYVMIHKDKATSWQEYAKDYFRTSKTAPQPHITQQTVIEHVLYARECIQSKNLKKNTNNNSNNNGNGNKGNGDNGNNDNNDNNGGGNGNNSNNNSNNNGGGNGNNNSNNNNNNSNNNGNDNNGNGNNDNNDNNGGGNGNNSNSNNNNNSNNSSSNDIDYTATCGLGGLDELQDVPGWKEFVNSLDEYCPIKNKINLTDKLKPNCGALKLLTKYGDYSKYYRFQSNKNLEFMDSMIPNDIASMFVLYMYNV